MRIGTWNLAGRWSPNHLDLLTEADCDVWLLTEVSQRVTSPGFYAHVTGALMQPTKYWAGVYSRRPLTGLPDPHPASAAAVVDGTTYCSSILPWKGSDGPPFWPGDNHAARTEFAVIALLGGLASIPLVWGGDWNHSLSGPEMAGSKAGREHILAAVDKLGLRVPTAELPHRLEGLLSIDHVAVASERAVVSAARLSAVGLSDHDCYVVELAGDT